MQPNELAHHFALLSLLIAVAGLSYIIKKWGKHHNFSLSTHAAMQKPSYWLFASCLIASGVLFYLFTVLWLMPTYNLGLWFGVLTVITVVCELVAALIPDNGGRRSLLHGTAAWLMAVLAMFIVVALLFVPGVSVIAKFILGVLLSYLVLDWFLFLFIKWSHKWFLVFQSSYILCFYLALLAVAYIR